MTLFGPLLDPQHPEPDAFRNPFPYFSRWRAECPVAFCDEAGFFVVSRYVDVRAVLSDPVTYSNANPFGPGVLAAAPAVRAALAADPDLAQRAAEFLTDRGRILFTADPPQHARHRRLLTRALSARAITPAEPRIRALIDDQIDRLKPGDRADIVGDVALPFTARYTAMLLGVPTDRHEDFVRWTTAINAPLGVLPAEQIRTIVRDQCEFFAFIEREITQCRTAPRQDLLSSIALAKNEGDEPFTDAEILGLVAQIVAAGVDTTAKLIASGILRLCADDTLMVQVRGGSMRTIGAFVEEMLRLASPVQGLFRLATEDASLGGVTIPKGSYIFLVFGSANRDTDVFPEAEKFSMGRESLDHVAFGHGIHFCVGAPLARIAARNAFQALLTRLHNLKVLDVTYSPSYILHGPSSLNVCFESSG